MNDNDLIKREDVVSLLDTFIAEYGKALIAEVGDIEEPMGAQELASIVTDIIVNIRSVVKAMHAVPQEMRASEYVVAREKMCHSFDLCGYGCPLWNFMQGFGETSCTEFEVEHPLDAVAIVVKWAQEHPEEVNDGEA